MREKKQGEYRRVRGEVKDREERGGERQRIERRRQETKKKRKKGYRR